MNRPAHRCDHCGGPLPTDSRGRPSPWRCNTAPHTGELWCDACVRGSWVA